ncbi:MAG: NUDIX domain-containing protein [Polyangiaceae bacterium]|jgi:phosphatase NudJ|nr:NUDIX domain-containing protein [Polyangiaceae bacterium]
MPRVAVPSYVYVLAVVEHEGRFLLIHEAKHGQGWYLPAGGVEPGETLVDALQRETLEEGGVRVEPTGILRVEQSWPSSAEGYGRFRFIFAARVVGSAEPKREADGHSLEARWVAAEEIPAYALRHPEVIEHVGRVRSGAPTLPLDGYGLACFPIVTR